MEQQAKERLTGGVILVVALVLLVPELLTGPRTAPPPPPAQPDQAPMRSYTMELGESARAREPVAASTAVAPAHEAPPAGSGPMTAAPPAAVASAPAAGLAAQSPTVIEPPAGPPAPAAPLRSAQHAPAEHAAEHVTAWTVQVGTFSSRDNAARVVAGLKSHGFTASVSEATRDGHKLFRVRVGSERDRAAAQKLLGRLKAAGQKSLEIVPR